MLSVRTLGVVAASAALVLTTVFAGVASATGDTQPSPSCSKLTAEADKADRKVENKKGPRDAAAGILADKETALAEKETVLAEAQAGKNADPPTHDQEDVKKARDERNAARDDRDAAQRAFNQKDGQYNAAVADAAAKRGDADAACAGKDGNDGPKGDTGAAGTPGTKGTPGRTLIIERNTTTVKEAPRAKTVEADLPVTG